MSLMGGPVKKENSLSQKNATNKGGQNEKNHFINQYSNTNF